LALAATAIIAFAATGAHADGTETLGPPSIGGVGLFEPSDSGYTNLTGDISISVPTNAVVKQVLPY
jgi:hypothetical protein